MQKNEVKKKITWLSVACVITFSLWVGKDLLDPKFLYSHDGLYHVLRLQQFHTALLDSQFPVRWAPTLLNGLGYPLFVINYHLPYYIAEAFHLAGLSSFDSIKAIYLVSIIGSAISSFYLFRYWTKSNLASIFGSILFTVAPYRLANIFSRGALGEALGYIFVPLLFLGAEHILKKKRITLFTIALTGLIVSHTPITIIFLPIALAYTLYFSSRKYWDLFHFAKAAAISILISAFQLVPAIFERQYINLDQVVLSSYAGHFKTIWQLLRIPREGINLGTRLQVGISHYFIAAISMLTIFTAKKYIKKQLIFHFVVAAASVFLVTKWSEFLWSTLFPLRYILYPWRFLGATALATSTMFVFFIAGLEKHKTTISFLLVALALYTNRHYIKVDKYIPEEIPSEIALGNGTTDNEFNPIWFNPETTQFAHPKAEAITGNAQISKLQTKTNEWTFTVNAQETSLIKLGHLYFPGWSVNTNGKPTKIYPSQSVKTTKIQKNLNGLITFYIPKGTHSIEAIFKETLTRQVGNIISLATVFALLLYQYKIRKYP